MKVLASNRAIMFLIFLSMNGLFAATIKKGSEYRLSVAQKKIDTKAGKDQKSLADLYKELDALTKLRYSKNPKEDWAAILRVLESAQGRIDVNKYRSKDNIPLLELAVSRQNIGVVKTLLTKYRANPNLAPAMRSWYPLQIACRKGDVAMVKLLLEYGANPYLREPFDHMDSFYLAAGNPVIMELLKKAKK